MTRLISVVTKFHWLAGSGLGEVVMNNHSSDGEIDVPDSWPYYRLDWPVKGLRDLPRMDDNTEPNTERAGITFLPSFSRERIVTCAGKVYGRSWIEMCDGVDTLLRVFGPDPATGEIPLFGKMTLIPDAATGAIQQTFFASCVAGGCSEDYPESENEQPSPFHSSFSFDLRNGDGRIFDWDPAAQSASNPHW